MPESNSLGRIHHIVVLMLENRSFDNLLGWLYDPENDPPFNLVPADFEGLNRGRFFNKKADGTIVYAGKTDDPRSPQPNPGEPFQDVYSQIYDVPLTDLKDVPPVPPQPPNMMGFIRNYADQKDKPEDPGKIMLSLTPKTVPVLSFLAHQYALFDHWFSSIPTQTFCNRSFVHAGTSSGYVNNGGGGLVFGNETRTVFDLLEDAGKSWTIFGGGWLLESFTLLIQKPLWKYGLTRHITHMNEFFSAAGKPDGLPHYSFIEPIYFDSLVWGAHNDLHPECNPWKFYGPSNAHNSERLVWSTYDAIRNGPNWEDTLLLILFDEHGGCYDHVPPPSAKECAVASAPDEKIIPQGQPGGCGFKFDRLGPRVPAIAVSAYTKPQTRIHRVFEHTSVLSTIVNCFTLPKRQLGWRQEKADDIGAALNLAEPRTDKPVIPKPESTLLSDLGAEAHLIGHWVEVHARLLDAKQKPVSDLQKDALRAAALMTQADYLHERIENLNHEFEADLLLMEHEAKWARSKLRR